MVSLSHKNVRCFSRRRHFVITQTGDNQQENQAAALHQQDAEILKRKNDHVNNFTLSSAQTKRQSN